VEGKDRHTIEYFTSSCGVKDPDDGNGDDNYREPGISEPTVLADDLSCLM
jgi:hypothetical protein